jgi:DNA/RNA-binding domain of Phe-tRNA-synthetase-like protein
MNLTIDPALTLKLGFLHLSGCRIAASPGALREIYDEVAIAAGESFADTPLGEHPVAGGVRRLFKSAGIDPSRYRPSGEALVRRILKGQGLYYINCIVDINNICSIESLFPLGAYDREHIIGDVTIRLGASDEVYRGIGKEINIAGKLVSADGESAFGSPIADSHRTKISEDTREVLILLYAPESTDDSDIRNTLNRFAGLASEHAGARTEDSGIHAAS